MVLTSSCFGSKGSIPRFNCTQQPSNGGTHYTASAVACPCFICSQRIDQGMWVVTHGLCDKGFAGAGEDLITPEGFTPPFASPEVLHPWVLKFAGDPVPHSDFAVIATAADVWSAGVLLFFILTSTLPFEADPNACQYIPSCLGPETERVQWAEWDRVRQSHGSWVSSFAKCLQLC